jgi:hypothetical protein
LNNAKVYESLIQWGNTGISGSVTPVDAAMSSEFSQNRLSFLNPDLITVEFTRNNGTNWYIYPKTYTDAGTTDTVTSGYEVITNTQKQSLVTDGLSHILWLGSRRGNQKASDKLRITILGDGIGLFILCKKILVHYCQAYGNGNYCLVEEAMANAPDTFKTVKSYSISGWTDWNSIPYVRYLGEWVSSNREYHTRKLRLTFGVTGITENSTTDIYIDKLRIFGTNSHAGGNSLTLTGHLYSFDVNKNATFPANLTSTGSLVANGITSKGALTVNQTLTVNGTGTSTLNGALTVKGSTTLGDTVTINNDSPTLLFRRGTLSDGKTDWRFIGDSGKFKLQAEVSGNAWTNVLEFSDIDDNTNKLSSYYSIDIPYDSRGFYLYGGCGIEKWSGYGPSLVAESGNDFWISNRSDRSARSKILHSSNYINYAAHTSAYCSTAAATAAKTAVCTNYTLTANTYTHLLITTSNTSKSALTLNINGKGAKRIWINGEISNENNYTLPAGTYLVFYDGFAYHINTEGHIPMYYKTSSRLYFTKKSVTMTTTLVPWYIKIELTGYAKPNQIIIKGEYNNTIDNAIIETSGFSKGYIYRNVEQNGGNIRGLWYKTVYDADEKRWIFWIKLDPI